MSIRIRLVSAASMMLTAAVGAQPIQVAAPQPATSLRTWGSCGCSTPSPQTEGLFVPNTWPGGVVYYRFHSQLNALQRQQVLEAMAVLSSVANLTFQERTNQPNYIEIIVNKKEADAGYSTSIGMSGHRQVVAIGLSGFQLRGLIMHELMHALGFWHEQQRPDREQFVNVREDLIAANEIGNWTIMNVTADGPYDFASLMHYQPWASSPTADRTLEVRAPYTRAWAYHIGQFTNDDALPSNGDIWALTRMYGGSPPPRAFVLQSPANGAAVGNPWAPSFAWAASEAATSYRLQVDDAPVFASPEIDIETTQTSAAGLPALAPDRLYWWRVIASNAHGDTEPFPLRALTFYTAPTYPATLFVDDSAPAGGTGANWGTALRDLALATETAYASAGAVTEIRVGQGTYTPAFGSADRKLSFWLADGCALRGGYAGYGAPDPNARDIAVYETVLSGDLAGDDQPGFVNIDENTFAVVFSLNNPPSTLLEGVTITEGNAESEAWVAPGIGGGLIADGNLTVRRCRFIANHANNFGGAVSLAFSGSDPLFEACLFQGNRMLLPAPESRIAIGGGAIQFHNSFGRLVDCVFTQNAAHAGGVAALNAARPTFINCLMSGNAATTSATVVPGGGALQCGAGSQATLINCTVVGNTSVAQGGAIIGDGGSPTSIANSIVWGNTPNQITGPAVVSYSDMQGGFAGTGNLNLAPAFANSGDHPYALAAGSPGLDAASNLLVPSGVSTDLRGAARFVDVPGSANTGVSGGAGGSAIVDMGAYERPGTEGSGLCWADCNLDGQLTVADFGCFQTMFVAGDPYADCNRDSALTVADFGCFQTEFVAGCP